MGKYHASHREAYPSRRVRLALCPHLHPYASHPKLTRIFGIAYGDETRAELRFAEIHSKAN